MINRKYSKSNFGKLTIIYSLKQQIRNFSKNKSFIDRGVEKLNNEKAQKLVFRMKEKAKALGLGPIAITHAGTSSRFPEYLKWILQGRHGEMHYLARQDRLERRQDLQKVLPGVNSIVVCTLFYWPGKRGFKEIRNDSTRGDISCYAWSKDYHLILNEKLEILAKFIHEEVGGKGKWYVDTGAILERDLGQRSGLGFIGKNTMLIHPRLGSGFFIGEILTTLSLPIDEPPKKMVGCGKCQRCQTACPTGALDEDYRMDARKCISYLTIELKESIPIELRPLMKNKIYGCDICQQVCPWNKFDWQDRIGHSPLFGSPNDQVTTPKLVELIQLTQEEFQRRFQSSPIRRIGRSRLLRNVAVALGNSRDVSVLPLLKKLVDAEQDEMIKEHLLWAIQQLENCMFETCVSNGR
eukprot:jgi/Galph1/3157/GphlegSOOS_G1772.1